MTIEESWITPNDVVPLNGDEEFVGMPGKVLDFWRFALSNLKMNNARGYLAEYIVAKALGVEDPRRVEWDACDVHWEGIEIEVKSTARLQSWEQLRLSAPSFGGLKSRRLIPRGDYAESATYNGDVYVFCAQPVEDHLQYEQLDVNQWKFWVLSRRVLESEGFKSIGMKRLNELARGETLLRDLPVAVRAAAAANV